MTLTTTRFTFSGHETFPFRYTWLPKLSHVVGTVSKNVRLPNAYALIYALPSTERV